MAAKTKFEDSRYEEKENTSVGVKIQYVPFKIEFDGNADVASEFSSYTKETVNGEGEDVSIKVLTNYFRGRPLMGSEIGIPSNYVGIVTTESKIDASQNAESETEMRNLNLVSNFDTFTYWNWDQPPSGMDSSRKLMDMLEISKSLYEPVNPECRKD